jgi:hypothetical protein
MVNTRNCNTNAENNDVENNNAANPSSTLEKVLMMKAQMLQTMQHTMVNMLVLGCGRAPLSWNQVLVGRFTFISVKLLFTELVRWLKLLII